ncbi:MAG: FAD-dependent oxidoreductase [Xanthomonadales bacterium]|nr:FAD-dependent oxidoreductase [Xanthomonadales bacterium]NIN60054.1 FAD-dependent oxidoreductase [Xanthomonadales bacterium]NIN75422.1 FAD-dependent oxidoreductase [Xanthomonadales bacterium]NIO14245.1 FAD-dependent oxidoreductase [Xanthomonadales bacterium]NIP12447.1 FAD-dependent oxidoreductase [Xanthomonadales bacterium]
MTDSVLIVGSGMAGLHAAKACADAGARAIVVERGPVVGGRLAATLFDPAGIGERSEGMRTPLMEMLENNENIEIITLAGLERLEGRPGHFSVAIRERQRFVTDDCTRCKNCHTVCPVVRPNEYDAGLTFRKAIYTPMSDTMPPAWVIDIESCLNTPPNYLPCQQCVEVCDDHAIFFNLPLETVHERQVGAVILAPGFRTEDPARFADVGYGAHPDVVSSAEMQRLLESPGPTGGFASKPSDEAYPESVLLVLDNPSHFALYIVASQVRQLLAQDVEIVAVLILASPGEEQEKMRELASESGIEVHWGALFKVDPGEENVLEVSYEDLSAHRFVRASYDMVVMCNDVEPPEGLAELAAVAGVDLDPGGYILAGDGNAVETSRPGVFVAGCASGPKNIRDSLSAAQLAATSATALIDPRLLQPEGTEAPAEASAAKPTGMPPDDMRQQIEQLLYALIDR